MKQSNNSDLVQNEQEISLLDAVNFLKAAWKSIAIFGCVGVIVATFYILYAPKQYEATAQIKMAQIGITNPTNPLGVSVEEPASLIARMQMPTNYDSVVIAACNYQEIPQAAVRLAREIKLIAPRGLANMVELKVLAESPEIAQRCAQAVVNQIAMLQMQVANPFIEEARIRLAQDNERIEAARKLIAKADQGGSAMSAAYLSARDEITYFLTDREKMLDLITSVKERGTKLVSPIYASEKQVSPKKVFSLLTGLFAGLVVGIAIALVRRFLTGMNRASKLGEDHV